MNRATRTFTALTICLLAAGPAFAQDNQGSGSMPSGGMSDQMAAPGSNVDMAGQHVYNSDGDWIGTVSMMTTDAHGQRLAAVRIERRLGIKGDTVLFPVGSLQPREKGGYMTNLSGDQIKQLPKANATNTP